MPQYYTKLYCLTQLYKSYVVTTLATWDPQYAIHKEIIWVPHILSLRVVDTFKLNVSKFNPSLVSKQLGYEDRDKDHHQDITAPEHYLISVIVDVCVCIWRQDRMGISVSARQVRYRKSQYNWKNNADVYKGIYTNCAHKPVIWTILLVFRGSDFQSSCAN